MKLALKIASSILATVSLVFFCIGNFADSKIEMMLDFMGFDGFVGIINLLAFVTFVVFAVAYIMLEIGIWLKGTGLRSASLDEVHCV